MNFPQLTIFKAMMKKASTFTNFSSFDGRENSFAEKHANLCLEIKITDKKKS